MHDLQTIQSENRRAIARFKRDNLTGEEFAALRAAVALSSDPAAHRALSKVCSFGLPGDE